MSNENLLKLKPGPSSDYSSGHQIWILSEFGKPIFSRLIIFNCSIKHFNLRCY